MKPDSEYAKCLEKAAKSTLEVEAALRQAEIEAAAYEDPALKTAIAMVRARLPKLINALSDALSKQEEQDAQEPPRLHLVKNIGGQ